MYSLIVAMDRNRIIGANGALPWNLPDDLTHFKTVTMNSVLIMGRKTFESIGRPLPGRTMIVISRTQKSVESSPALYAQSFEEALQRAECLELPIFVIGGEEIFRIALPKADQLFITHIDADVRGDRFFPSFPAQEWKLTSSTLHPADDRHAFSFTFATYSRSHTQ